MNHQFDSIQSSFNKEVDSLKKSYASTKGKIETLKSKLMLQQDSLTKIGQPAEQYTGKIDSLNQKIVQLQQKTTEKINSLKSKTTDKIKALNLPPEVRSQTSKLTASMDKLSVPSLDTELNNKLGLGNLNTALPNLPNANMNTSIPGANLPNASIPALGTGVVQENMDQVDEIAGQASGIQSRVKGITDVSPQKIEGALETQASKLDEVKAIQGQQMPTGMEGVSAGIPTNADQVKEQLADLAKKEAVNHFAGKEAALQSAMDKVGKFKEKYSSVQSIQDLPKKAPNPLKGKQFVERLVPGITLQFQSFHNFSLDVNLSGGYKFTQRIVAGLGWNQRWAYDGGGFVPSARIYGVRSYGEFHFKKGFALRADLECMNTQVKPVTQTTETTHREWIWSAFSGIKQEYSITKNFRGNVQLLYNLFDPHYKSPYTDRLNYRMGFELTLKKRKKPKGI